MARELKTLVLPLIMIPLCMGPCIKAMDSIKVPYYPDKDYVPHEGDSLLFAKSQEEILFRISNDLRDWELTYIIPYIGAEGEMLFMYIITILPTAQQSWQKRPVRWCVRNINRGKAM